MKPELKKIEFNITVAECETVATIVLNSMLNDFPSAFDNINCYVPNCGIINQTPLVSFNYLTQSDNLDGLQSYITQRIEEEKLNCNYIDSNDELNQGQKERRTTSTESHLIIEILNWEGI